MTLIYRLTGRPFTLRDVAEELKSDGQDQTQVIEQWVSVNGYPKLRRWIATKTGRFYPRGSIEDIQRKLKEYGITSGVTQYVGRD